jgi:hypothetical protein
VAVGTDRWPLLGGTERKLYGRVARLLPADEEIRAALVAFTGPGAGVNVAAAGFLGLLGGAVGAVLSALGLNQRRTFMTIVVTDRGVVTFANRSLRDPKPPATRYPDVDVIGEIDETFGESFLEINGARWSTEGIWSAELYKMKRLRRSD